MDQQEIISEWVRRLRSGEYAQDTGALNRDGKFCCLGVLCEIAVEEGVIAPPQKTHDGLYYYGGAVSFLPEVVQEWANITQQGSLRDRSDSLAGLNDSGRTFSMIADKIETVGLADRNIIHVL